MLNYYFPLFSTKTEFMFLAVLGSAEFYTKGDGLSSEVPPLEAGFRWWLRVLSSI